MTTTYAVVSGAIAFAIFWVLAVFPAIPLLPIGRTAGSLLAAALMVVSGVLSPDEAYSSIDLAILGLLFGTMTVVVYLERADMFKYLGKLLTWRSLGAKDFTARISLVSAVSSAIFTNDTSCVALTEYLLVAARENSLSPRPFLLALASSANIGSSATPIGNPQNLIIALKGKISFLDFLRGLLPAAIVGVLVNAVVLLCLCWCLLGGQTGEESMKMNEDGNDHPCSADSSGFTETDHVNHGRSSMSIRVMNQEPENGNELPPPEMVPLLQSNMDDNPDASQVVSVDHLKKDWKRVLWKTSVYLITVGMVIAMLMGLDMSWSAICAAMALIVLDFKDAQPCLEKVSYSLLVFFCGMFITVDGFNETGIPGAFWDAMEPYAQIDSVSGIAVLAIVVLILCNLISNVPTVLLLASRIAASAGKVSAEYERKAWLIIAWVSTVSGNLTLLGSAANLIVCEQARLAPTHLSYSLSFWEHLVFGVPSTLLVTAIGLTLI